METRLEGEKLREETPEVRLVEDVVEALRELGPEARELITLAQTPQH